jgi:predicted RNA-binding protein
MDKKKEHIFKDEQIKEKQNILWILKNSKHAVKKEDSIKLKNLSNHTIHTASIEQDPDSITIAVLIYSLSKIIGRKRYTRYKGWPEFYKSYIQSIDNSIKDLQNNDIKKFRKHISDIRKNINKLSGNLKEYIQDVFRKARINKASRIYEHGISMEQTARLLGITLWELAEYAGQTGISDVNLTVTMPIKKRIKIAEDIFK